MAKKRKKQWQQQQAKRFKPNNYMNAINSFSPRDSDSDDENDAFCKLPYHLVLHIFHFVQVAFPSMEWDDDESTTMIIPTMYGYFARDPARTILQLYKHVYAPILHPQLLSMKRTISLSSACQIEAPLLIQTNCKHVKRVSNVLVSSETEWQALHAICATWNCVDLDFESCNMNDNNYTLLQAYEWQKCVISNIAWNTGSMFITNLLLVTNHLQELTLQGCLQLDLNLLCKHVHDKLPSLLKLQLLQCTTRCNWSNVQYKLQQVQHVQLEPSTEMGELIRVTPNLTSMAMEMMSNNNNAAFFQQVQQFCNHFAKQLQKLQIRFTDSWQSSKTWQFIQQNLSHVQLLTIVGAQSVHSQVVPQLSKFSILNKLVLQLFNPSIHFVHQIVALAKNHKSLVRIMFHVTDYSEHVLEQVSMDAKVRQKVKFVYDELSSEVDHIMLK